MTSSVIGYVDMHTAGEPVRIVTSGYPALAGATILDKRREAREQHDRLRRMLMLEPRGHAGMYGAIPVEASVPGAAFGVLFTHQEGYSTMCGHATVALGRWAVDSGRIAMRDGTARFGLETPCGVVAVTVEAGEPGLAPLVEFESVPASVERLDAAVCVPGFGRVELDIAFGGAFYAILPASRIGLSLLDDPLETLVAAGTAITAAAREALSVRHPEQDDLSFLYGTLLTDDVPLDGTQAAPSYNLCIFAEGQIDRSPTGSGVTARLALAAHRGTLAAGGRCEIRGVSGEGFVGRLASSEARGARIVSRVCVAGRAYYAGRGEFIAESADRFADGFVLPKRLREIAGA